MNTYQIEVQSMLNPGGSVTASLTVTQPPGAGPVAFSYGKQIQEERTTELAAFERAFLETLAESGLADRTLSVQVRELTVNPNNENRFAILGALLAGDLLKQMKR